MILLPTILSLLALIGLILYFSQCEIGFRTRNLASVSAVFVLLCAGVSVNQGTAAEQLPNFVVIFCDNLGYGDIEPFGSELNKTPNLNRMAREGRKFSHFCVTAGVCTPSRASLMTGCYAQRVGMHDNPRDGQVLRPVSPYGLDVSELTIAEVLRARGYATAIIGKWHLGDQPEFLPTRHGFDSFFGIPYSDDMTQTVGQRLAKTNKLDGARWPPLPLMDGTTVVEAPADRNQLTRRYTEKAMQFISSHADQPFFLYLPHAMPGSTTKPFSSDRFRGSSLGGPWGDCVQELDWSTGQILDTLVDLGIAENTLVIWTSDNGAPIATRPNASHRGSNLPLHGRGYTTSEGAFRVPTIMWWPKKVPANTQCEALCTTMDLLPTFANLAGDTQDHPVDGYDITQLLTTTADSTTSPYEVFYYYERDQLQAVRSGPWKLFVPLTQFSRHPHFQKGSSDRPILFNVVDDIGCLHNVSDDNASIVERLLELAELGREDLGDRGQAGAGQRPPGKTTGRPIAQLLP